MYRYPETLNFRAPTGTTDALNAIAEAEGKRVSTLVREAVEELVRRQNNISVPRAA